jgi:hypothetical protein
MNVFKSAVIPSSTPRMRSPPPLTPPTSTSSRSGGMYRFDFFGE